MIKTYQITDYVGFKDALINYYGDGVTIYYNSSGSVIFKIPAISDKVFRFWNNNLYAQYGTSWETGDAIVGAVGFGGSNYSGTMGASWILILNDNFLINSKTHNGRLHIVGKLTNGDEIALGLYYTTSYNTNTLGFNLATGGNIYPVGLNGSLLSNSGKIYKIPLYFTTVLNDALVNSDGSLAYIDGLYCSSYKVGVNQTLTMDFWMSASEWHMADKANALVNSLVVPLN